MPDTPDDLTYYCGGEIDAGEFILTIDSETLDPDEITQRIGLAPTSSHRPGDIWADTGLTQDYGEWSYASGRLDFRSRDSFQEQFDSFVGGLPQDRTFWDSVAANHNAQILIALWIRTWNREFDISSFALSDLARGRLRLHIDTYYEAGDEA